MTPAASAPTVAEVQDLLRQWRAVMGASRPRWRSVDLTLTQLRALAAITHRSPLRVGELAEELGIGLAGASALADRMYERGLIARRDDPADRRSVLLEPAPRGRRLLERLERGATEHWEKLIGRMTPAERDAFATTIRAFVRLSPEIVIRKEPSGLVSVRRVATC